MLSVFQLNDLRARGEKILVLDVRGQEEWDSGHLEGSQHIYIGHLQSRLSEVPNDGPIAVICTVGHRASVATSILLQADYRNVRTVLGSVKAWTAAGFPLVKD